MAAFCVPSDACNFFLRRNDEIPFRFVPAFLFPSNNKVGPPHIPMIHPHHFADYRLYYILLCNFLLLAYNLATIGSPNNQQLARTCSWVFVFVFLSFFVLYARQISHVRVGSALYWTGIVANTIGLGCFALAHSACSSHQAHLFNQTGATFFVVSCLLLISSAAIPYHKEHELPTIRRLDKVALVVGSVFFLLGSVALCRDASAVYLPVGLFAIGRLCFIVPSVVAVQAVPDMVGNMVE
jgi:hypothetical protein